MEEVCELLRLCKRYVLFCSFCLLVYVLSFTHKDVCKCEFVASPKHFDFRDF